MADGTDVVGSLYDRLVLRDFLGKVVPGTLLVTTGYWACLSSSPTLVATVVHVSQAPWGLWVLLASLGWIVGVAVQAAGEIVGVILYYPRGVTEAEFMRKLVALEKASSGARQAHERLVVIKEACGNAGIALVLSMLLILFRLWRGQALGRALLAVLALVAAAALLRMHRLHVARQQLWVEAVVRTTKTESSE
jgi:hypothetical protein